MGLERNIKLLNIIQMLVVIGVALFTAWWTYRTFAYKDRINELKELKRLIMLFHWKISRFCGQVRENKDPDEREIKEKLELFSIHNKFLTQLELSLYSRGTTKEKIKSIVSAWLIGDRLNIMQHRKNQNAFKKEQKEAWKNFNKEFEKVKKLIDADASRFS